MTACHSRQISDQYWCNIHYLNQVKFLQCTWVSDTATCVLELQGLATLKLRAPTKSCMWSSHAVLRLLDVQTVSDLAWIPTILVKCNFVSPWQSNCQKWCRNLPFEFIWHSDLRGVFFAYTLMPPREGCPMGKPPYHNIIIRNRHRWSKRESFRLNWDLNHAARFRLKKSVKWDDLPSKTRKHWKKSLQVRLTVLHDLLVGIFTKHIMAGIHSSGNNRSGCRLCSSGRLS